MPSRPAVSAALRRKILVEAGHRCAIHSCRNPDVDVHHIVPWDKCQEHNYENLIALCPNCHRRADLGEIDRKSLRLYKAQLTAASGIAGHERASHATTRRLGTQKDRWLTSLLEESQEAPVPYEISVEFPQFLPDQGDLGELNTIVQAGALSRILECRRHLLGKPFESDRPSPAMRDSCFESFEVSLLTDALVSIKYSITDYGVGAAHPNHFTRADNYQRDPLIPLGLSDILPDQSAAIAAIAAYSQSDLARQKDLPEPDDWIIRGAAPDRSNYQAFNILPRGLLFTFDQYQVGSYAEGPYQVYLPAEQLRRYVNPSTAVAALWVSAT